MTRDREPTDQSAESEAGLRIRLFDADRTDRILSFDDALAKRASARQLLWIDIEGDLLADRLRALVERFELPASVERALRDPAELPGVRLHGRHFQLRVAAEPDAKHPERIDWLDILAGPNVVISRHVAPIQLLEGMNERIAADATIGELDSAEFVASLLEAVVTSYHAAIDRIEDELDDVDGRTLGRQATDGLFNLLVGIRRRVGRLRHLLAAHREVFDSVGRPDFGQGIDSTDPAVFASVSRRFEGVLVSVESTREVVLASFEVLMTRTAQRTNDVMRVLTLVTALAVPATIMAGLLGMNVVVPVSPDDPASFWLILGIIASIEGALLGVARLKGWI